MRNTEASGHAESNHALIRLSQVRPPSLGAPSGTLASSAAGISSLFGTHAIDAGNAQCAYVQMAQMFHGTSIDIMPTEEFTMLPHGPQQCQSRVSPGSTTAKQPRRNHLKAVINHRRHRGSPCNERLLGRMNASSHRANRSNPRANSRNAAQASARKYTPPNCARPHATALISQAG